MNGYAIVSNIVRADEVFSGYMRCSLCINAKSLKKSHGVCIHCERRVFEYGVLHKGKFVPYREIINSIRRGHKYIDGANGGLPISSATFRTKNAIDKKCKKRRGI